MTWLRAKPERSLLLAMAPAVCILWAMEGSAASALPVNDLSPAEQLDLDPAIIDHSPVLQRWLEDVPDIQADLKRDPSFRSRLRLGYTTDTSDQEGGIAVGVEDIFVGQTGLTISGDYRTNFSNADEQYGIDLHYYLLPLGHRVNIAPVVGYRSIAQGSQDTEGVNVGVQLMIVPSSTGAADVSLSQTWVNLGSDRQVVSRFTLSAGYAITQHLRLSSDIHIQTSDQDQNTTVGLLLEWPL
ncbi:MAG: hypothetical protein F6K30_20280 [Cyanothece sp. SIO2G6]|nr:hypothetical protein [Cyanothece sp. SIO2G6]